VSWYRTAIGGHHDRRAEDHPCQGWLGLLELAKQLGNAKRDGTSGVNTLKWPYAFPIRKHHDVEQSSLRLD
jgi:hypothetical protein